MLHKAFFEEQSIDVQEVETHFYSNLLYKMGHYFVDIQYVIYIYDLYYISAPDEYLTASEWKSPFFNPFLYFRFFLIFQNIYQIRFIHFSIQKLVYEEKFDICQVKK